MPYDFKSFKNKTNDVSAWLQKECAQIRTGRATPNLLDGISVESFGSRVPLSQVGSIGTEDPKTLRVTPWDMTQAKHIEKAITVANLGLSVVLDDKGVRVIFPELSSERRASLVKLAKEKLEEAKKTIRMERDKEWNLIQKKEKEGGMGEDEKFRLKKEMEKIVDEVHKKLDEIISKKEKEILS
ncbi:MAG: ribosome recycling factor [Candidatus Pacebacteria bacterium]|nr:ribosome recycling factor [Candidatus Paceibacterota bacterium]MDD5357319.1 ribosome recycling factor [Candidatus Paceibacterota bacterium]